MIKPITAALALGLAWPALAQAPGPTPASEAAPSAAQLAAARPVIEKLWPLGTYRRMMDGTMSKMMESMFDSMFAMKAADVLPEGDAKKELGDTSMGAMAEAQDPHFRERMKITTDVMFKEMLPLFDKFEPAIRDSLTTSYARRFTPAQLADMNVFFATPSGKAFAEQWMMSFVDPELMKNLSAFAPEMLKAMPDIMGKVEAATAHLPPPPKPAQTEDEPDSTDDAT